MKRLAVIAALAACGAEELPLCQDNVCELPARTIVQWSFNDYPNWQFTGDTCLDLGVQTLHVEATNLDDPAAIVEVKDVACGQGQATFQGLTAGTYDIAVTPVDSAGVALVHAATRVEALAGDADVTVVAAIPYEAWTGVYRGTFLFRLAWAGMSCDVAEVATQTLTLTVNGQLVSALTDAGQRLDGTDPRACRPLTEQFAQYAPQAPAEQPGIPFGPAELTVVGRNALDEVTYEHTFRTFVGAAKNNPTITFDVEAWSPPM